MQTRLPPPLFGGSGFGSQLLQLRCEKEQTERKQILNNAVTIIKYSIKFNDEQSFSLNISLIIINNHLPDTEF